MSDSFQQQQYVRLRKRLTTKNNKLKAAVMAAQQPRGLTAGVFAKADVLQKARAVIEEADYADSLFLRYGYPDAWHNWVRAKEDAQAQLQRLGGAAQL